MGVTDGQPMSSPLDYEFCARTDVGRVRSNNEDALTVCADVRLIVVADGMGGYNAGEVASAMAVQVIEQELGAWLVAAGQGVDVTLIRETLAACVDRANTDILNAALAHPEYAGMGTTLVVGVFVRDRLLLGHIGDSRGYLLRDKQLSCITRDHTWLQEQVDSGLMTPQDARHSGMRNLLTRALGVDSQVLLEINEFRVQADDLFLFCTDGLTDRMNDQDLEVLLRDPSPLPLLAERLLQQVNALGGRDNTSVILARPSAAAAGMVRR